MEGTSASKPHLLVPLDGSTTTTAISAEPALAIVAAAKEVDADLIVMSTRALVGPSRWLRGSVATVVVRCSHRPVLLVHRTARARGQQVARPGAPGNAGSGDARIAAATSPGPSDVQVGMDVVDMDPSPWDA
jgi:Universal stress protein family